jgi:hypothetical protein
VVSDDVHRQGEGRGGAWWFCGIGNRSRSPGRRRWTVGVCCLLSLFCDEGRMDETAAQGGSGQHGWVGQSHAGTAGRHWPLSSEPPRGLGARAGSLEITRPAPSNVGPSNSNPNMENINLSSTMPCQCPRASPSCITTSNASSAVIGIAMPDPAAAPPVPRPVVVDCRSDLWMEPKKPKD